MKPSRTCERSKREGVWVEPDNSRFAEHATAEGAKNLMGGALIHGRRSAVEAKQGGTRKGSLKRIEA
jgi:hypothetical protein